MRFVGERGPFVLSWLRSGLAEVFRYGTVFMAEMLRSREVMLKHRVNQRGFAPPLVIFAIIVVSVIAGAAVNGWINDYGISLMTVIAILTIVSLLRPLFLGKGK